MTLRSEVHVAIDQLAPSTAGLSDRVVQTMLAEVHVRRRPVWAGRLRVPLSLVAVLVLVALLLGALVGGRLVADWNTLFNPPVNVGVDRQLQALESRTLTQPLIKAGDPCPGGPWDPSTGWWGTGPVFVNSAISSGYGTVHHTAWGIYTRFHAETSDAATGLVLIRARDLVTGQELVFVGDYVAGKFVGTDTLDGALLQQRSELVLDTSHPPGAPTAGFIDWTFTVGVKEDAATPSPGNLMTLPPTRCTGWQIDGKDFSYTFEVPI